MLISKLKIATAVVLTVGMVAGTGTGLLVHRIMGADTQVPTKESPRRHAPMGEPKKTVAEDKSVENELQKLQGTWVLTACESDGQEPVPQDVASDRRWLLIISADQWKEGAQKAAKSEGHLRIDPRQNPKIMNRYMLANVAEGIYELTGDSLKMCMGHTWLPNSGMPPTFATKGPRPKDFRTQANSGVYVYHWKRVATPIYHIELTFVRVNPNGRDLGEDGKGDITAAPAVRVNEGQEARVLTGGEGRVMVPAGNERPTVSFVPFGLGFKATIVRANADSVFVDATLWESKPEPTTTGEAALILRENNVRLLRTVKLNTPTKLILKHELSSDVWVRFTVKEVPDADVTLPQAPVAVSTTASVPDGGTVLMGGLKALREGQPAVMPKREWVRKTYAVSDLIKPDKPDDSVYKFPKAPLEERLIKVITNSIEPQTWATTGGRGTIEFYPLGNSLIVFQAPEVHEQIAELLDMLRRNAEKASPATKDTRDSILRPAPERFNAGGYRSMRGFEIRRERETEKKLAKPITFRFKDTPLSKVIDQIREMTGANIQLDVRALAEEHIPRDRPMSFEVAGIELKDALTALLAQAELTYVVTDEFIWITSPERARGKLIRRTYNVADLLELPPQAGTGNARGEKLLIKLITDAVEPERWSSQGGPGTIEFFPAGKSLVVCQTPDVHEQVADLLTALKRLKELPNPAGPSDKASPKVNASTTEKPPARSELSDLCIDKLTRVTFKGRTHSTHEGRVTVFEGQVNVIHKPAESVRFADPGPLPPGCFSLQCDKLIVSKKASSGGDVLSELKAVGNAVMRSDDFTGRGEVVRIDVSQDSITLEGYEGRPAEIQSMKAKDTPAQVIRAMKITYSLKTKEYTLDGSGGINLGSAPKKSVGTKNNQIFSFWTEFFH